MTYAETFLLVWAIIATFIAADYRSDLKRYERLIMAMSETTKRIVFNDEDRDAARKLYESAGITKDKVSS